MTGIIPILSALTGLVVSCILGFVVIPYLHKLKFGQTILDIGPKWHKKKQGTPTMGGVLIIAGTVIGLAVAYIGKNKSILAEFNNPIKLNYVISGLGLAIGMGLIGFIDDYIKVVKKRNLGLTARQKTILQLLVSATYLLSLALSGMSCTWIPFIGEIDIMHGFGLIFWIIALFFIYGFTNAVNLTDGIDGLAASVTTVVACAFMLLAGYFGFIGTNALAAALAGACVGFLLWNSHPAKVFMGDTGSMFLGGAVVGLSFGIGKPVLLIIAGIIYLIEALSVMLQVAYFKKTKKRLFKMSPIHHHFELSGWSEEKIGIVFSLVTLVMCVIAAVLAVYC